MKLLSGLGVVAFGLVLIGLALICAFRRPAAERFLNRFASSARAHYVEQTLRLIAGAALVVFSPAMWHSVVFEWFGWLIVVTAAGLFLVPWRWHHRFGQWVIPFAIRYLRLYAFAAFAMGIFILHGASRAILA